MPDSDAISTTDRRLGKSRIFASWPLLLLLPLLSAPPLGAQSAMRADGVTFSDDFMCFSGASSTHEYPAALL